MISRCIIIHSVGWGTRVTHHESKMRTKIEGKKKRKKGKANSTNSMRIRWNTKKNDEFLQEIQIQPESRRKSKEIHEEVECGSMSSKDSYYEIKLKI